VKARLLHREKRRYDDGALLEMKLWQVPAPVAGSRHALKYSLYYGRDGVRIVGYDNERGKGDHRHFRDREEAYSFSTVRRLMEDFLADVATARGGE
jgi:hypothetical protein